MRGEIKIMADDKEVPLSSFMAGLLLCRRSITYSELSNEMSRFIYTITEPNGDFNKIATLINDDNKTFTLKYDYTDIINNMTIYDYLYSLTDSDVRKYFGIPEKEIVSDNNIVVVRKRTLFDKLKRTKAVC